LRVHSLNRAAGRLRLFRKAPDYEAFLRVLDEALERHPMRVLGYCIMPTHWHVVLWPAAEGELSAFLRWLTLTHSVRWHKHYHSTGSGHVYQNRFKAFAVAEDEHLLSVLRYVERNPLVEPGMPFGGRRTGCYLWLCYHSGNVIRA
jgi:putative transposase